MSLIKACIRLLIVAALAHATWRIGSAYAIHYRWVDSAREATQFRMKLTDEQLKGRLIELATLYGIPITEDQITIRSDQFHTFVEGGYIRPIEIIPRATYQWPFKFQVDTLQEKTNSRVTPPQ